MNDGIDPRAGRRKALTDLLNRYYNRELKHDDDKAAVGLLIGEVIQVLANIDRIAHALERIADALESGTPGTR